MAVAAVFRCKQGYSYPKHSRKKGIATTQRCAESKKSCPKGLVRTTVGYVVRLIPLFCVLNSDIGFTQYPFSRLLVCQHAIQASVVALVVLSPEGSPEYCVKHFPSFSGSMETISSINDECINLPLVSLYCFPVGSWLCSCSFEPRFSTISMVSTNFLYYGDVDICAHLWKAGEIIVLGPGVIGYARCATN